MPGLQVFLRLVVIFVLPISGLTGNRRDHGSPGESSSHHDDKFVGKVRVHGFEETRTRHALPRGSRSSLHSKAQHTHAARHNDVHNPWSTQKQDRQVTKSNRQTSKNPVEWSLRSVFRRTLTQNLEKRELKDRRLLESNNHGTIQRNANTAQNPSPSPMLSEQQCSALVAVNLSMSPSNWRYRPSPEASGGSGWQGTDATPPAPSASSEASSLFDTSSTCSCSSWPNVTCDFEGSIVTLYLADASGTLPESMSQLSRLSELHLMNYSPNLTLSWDAPKLPELSGLTIEGSLMNGARFQDLDWISALTSLQSLRLLNTALSGALPEVLAELSLLTSFEVVGSSLPVIPFWISLWTSLERLEVSSSQVYQDFPLFLGDMTNLTCLNLSTNQFWGTVPQELFNLSSLQALNLSHNLISGPLPQGISQLVSLSSLDLSFNKFSGPVPSSLFTLTFMELLDLGHNWLAEPVPAIAGSARSITYLDLSYNRFSGPFSEFSSVLSTLTGLVTLDLSYNNLTGPLTSHIASLVELTELLLHSNSLVGTLDSLSSLYSLAYVSIFDNSFSGPIPVALSRLPHLQAANFSMNKLSGPFPAFVFDMPELWGFSLSDNDLSGPLPDIKRWFGRGRDLVMDLRNNEFTGPLPDLSRAMNLVYVNFAYNSFDGSFSPAAFSGLKKLLRLVLRGCDLSGAVPDLSFLPSLQVFDAAKNHFTTWELPPSASLGNLISLDLSGNRLQGSIPDAVSLLSSLSVLNLAGNELSGDLPSSLALASLESLALHSNSFSGSFPEFICRLTGLEMLSLARNSFSGQLPPCLQALSYLSLLDISYNYLYGDVPPKTPAVFSSRNNFFSRGLPLYTGVPFCPNGTPMVVPVDKTIPFQFSNYVVNQSLANNCFAIPEWCANGTHYEPQRTGQECAQMCSITLGGPPCAGAGNCTQGADGSFTCACFNGNTLATVNGTATCIPSTGLGAPLTVVIALASTLAAVVAAVLLALVLCRCKKKQEQRQWDDLDLCQQFSLREMELATEQWSKDRKLGEGGYGIVYKGQSAKGELWAVKRAKLMTNDFETEVRAMAALNHPNLVRLLGFCVHYEASSGTQEQILVYELVSNGDLQGIMQKRGKQLSLQERVRIVAEAAEGLAYLHSFDSPIVHRDIKPGNILLNDQMRAKVADFGLLRKLEGDDQTRIVGTPGFMDPDYVRAKILTPKLDVYSLGVVLLQLISGQPLATEEGHITQQIKELFEQAKAREVLDTCLEAPEEAVLELTLVAVDAVRCPSLARPTMAEVVARLRALLVKYQNRLDALAEAPLHAGNLDGRSSCSVSFAGLTSSSQWNDQESTPCISEGKRMRLA